MRSNKKDNDFTEENFKKQFKQISRAERPNAAISKSLQDSKNRITIYLDADIIEYFKNAGQEAKEGYQTLINRTLREVIRCGKGRSLQTDLLNDQQFLSELKTKLKTV
jgi:uncharacterized protein (DUF4415 family)